MPKLRISVSKPTRNLKATELVRRITGLGVSSAAKRLAEGPSGWLMTADLHKGDHLERASDTRAMIEGLTALGITPYILYAAGSTPWDEVLLAPRKFEVAPEVILEMLAEPYQEFD
jgi:hypothetical protein